MQEKPAWKQWNDGAGLLVVYESTSEHQHGRSRDLRGVSLPWMEVIDEADGFHCFGVELLRARHGSSTLFQCELGAKQGVLSVYPPAGTVTILPFGV